MAVKVKETFEKTKHVKNDDKSKKYYSRGQRNVRYHDRVLYNKKKSYNLWKRHCQCNLHKFYSGSVIFCVVFCRNSWRSFVEFSEEFFVESFVDF